MQYSEACLNAVFSLHARLFLENAINVMFSYTALSGFIRMLYYSIKQTIWNEYVGGQRCIKTDACMANRCLRALFIMARYISVSIIIIIIIIMLNIGNVER